MDTEISLSGSEESPSYWDLEQVSLGGGLAGKKGKKGDPLKSKVFNGLSHIQARTVTSKSTTFLSHHSFNSRS